MPSIESYHDVRAVLDKVLKAGGGSYKLPSPGKAIRWRQRAYAFRKQLREERGDLRYEVLVIRALAKGESTCVIEIRSDEGEFTPTDTPQEVPYIQPESSYREDELDEVAREVREKLGLE